MTTIFEIFGTAKGGTKVKYSSLIKGAYDIAILDEVNNELFIRLTKSNKGIDLKNFAIDTIETTSFVNSINGSGKLIEKTTKGEHGNQLILKLQRVP